MHPIDKYNYEQDILDTSKMFLKGIGITKNIRLDLKESKSIILCGMGGSALHGYLLKTLLSIKVPVFVHTNYSIPQQITKNPLFLICSFSGNTEEALDSYQKAKKTGHKIIVFSNGGKLKQLAEEDGFQNVGFGVNKKGFQPRFALPLAFASISKLLENGGLLEGLEDEIIKTSEFIKKENTKNRENMQKIAKSIIQRIPVFYAPYNYRYIALISKIKVNENAKRLAYWNFYPELNHNEMNGYKNDDPEKVIIIDFQDEEFDHPRNLIRSKATNELLRSKGYKTVTIKLKGNSLLTKAFFGLNLSDWLSYHLAISIGQDPAPVDMVEDFKKIIKN